MLGFQTSLHMNSHSVLDLHITDFIFKAYQQ